MVNKKDTGIVKRLEAIEKSIKDDGGVCINICIIEQDGKIICNGREITREKYENLKRGSKDFITIIDDLEEVKSDQKDRDGS